MPTTSDAAGLLWQETVRPGASWSHVLRRGRALRMTAGGDGANAGALFYNADMLTERYNMADTLKAQYTGRLTKGNVLFSDMGRVLCSIVDDSLGWHDPIAGCGNAALNARRYGDARYQELRNECYRNAFDSFLIELAKYGLGRRDLTANVNFFSKVTVDDSGGMHYAPRHARKGDFVELRAEMNVLVILNTCPHPMDPSPHYAPQPVELSVRRVDEAGADDECRLSRPENARGFELTERYFA